MEGKNVMRDVSNREFKASAFTTYYSEPENAADLYRGLEHAEDVGPEDIVYTTLSGVMFMARKNDMAFTARKKVLVIYFIMERLDSPQKGYSEYPILFLKGKVSLC